MILRALGLGPKRCGVSRSRTRMLYDRSPQRSQMSAGTFSTMIGRPLTQKMSRIFLRRTRPGQSQQR